MMPQLFQREEAAGGSSADAPKAENDKAHEAAGNTHPAPASATLASGEVPDSHSAHPSLQTPDTQRAASEQEYSFWRQPHKLWQNISLNVRLVMVVTAMLAWGLTLSGVTVLGILQNHLLGQIDSELQTSATSLTGYSLNSLRTNAEPSLPTEYYIQIRFNAGNNFTVVSPATLKAAGTPNIKDLPLTSTDPDDGVSAPVTITSNQPGKSWRAVTVPLVQANTQEPAGVAIVALPLNTVSKTLHNTALYVLFSSIALIVTGAAIASYLVRRALMPLMRIEKVANQIASGDLSRRIEESSPRTEVGSLAHSLNMMLAHIETAFAAQEASEAKMRRFISDASHELRTPLSAVRGYGELYRMGGVPPERVPEVMERIESEARRMGILVESLLTLARLDEGRKLRFGDVDVLALAKGAQMDCSALDPQREVTLLPLLPGEALEPIKICADRDQITQVFTNIIGNIIRYTPKGSPVEIALGRIDNGRVRIEFRDHGSGIPDADKQRVFQRFYRSDKSRSREFGGSGLGLSIVEAIIAAHGGTVHMQDTPGGGLTVVMVLPIQRVRIVEGEVAEVAATPESDKDNSRNAKADTQRGKRHGFFFTKHSEKENAQSEDATS